MSSGSHGKEPIRVGVICTASKFAKNKLAEFATLGESRGFVISKEPLSLERDLDEQCERALGGRPDVIVAKFTEQLVLLDVAGERGDAARAAMSRWRSFTERHPGLVVIDPLPSQVKLTSRTGVAESLAQISASCQQLGMSVSTPRFGWIEPTSPMSAAEQVAAAGLRFPIVVKPEQACGSAESHLMGIAFRPDGLQSFALPFFAQEYYDHDAVVHKIYVVEPHFFCAQRTSLENFGPERADNFMFDSQTVNHRLQRPAADAPPAEIVAALVSRIAALLGMSIFGFDLIRSCGSDEWSVIDVNFFPGFNECTSESHGWLLQLIETKIAATRSAQ